jgi:Nif-specific regulatory protein
MIEIELSLNRRLLRKSSFTSPRITVGRSPDNDIVLDDPRVSRLHAVIEKRGSGYFLDDQSTNGTILDNVPVNEPLAIGSPCTISIHPFSLHCIARADEVTAPLTLPVNRDFPPPDRPPRPTGSRTLHFGFLIGETPSMREVYRTIGRAAASTASVLIRGKSGTGKELVAQAIHAAGNRRDAPFVALDCAAIPEPLIESELFGFEKGAFTGASASKKGWFEQAGGGTIFLDEIGELSLPAQAKLLRFLQDRSFARLGGTRRLQADVRLIAATNKDLEEAVHQERFRSDLYYRLRVVQILLPPLCERKGDISMLTEHILSAIAEEHQLSQTPALTPTASARLQAYHWPGNVRQLQNVLYHAFITTPAPHVMDEADLDLPFGEALPRETLQEMNREFLLETLRGCGWDTARAAKRLNVSRGTIYYRSKKLGIDIRQLAK